MHLSNTDGIKAASMGQKTALVFNSPTLALFSSRPLSLPQPPYIDPKRICPDLIPELEHANHIKQLIEYSVQPPQCVLVPVWVLSALSFHMGGGNMVKKMSPCAFIFNNVRRKIWVYSEARHPSGPSYTHSKHTHIPPRVHGKKTWSWTWSKQAKRHRGTREKGC